MKVTSLARRGFVSCLVCLFAAAGTAAAVLPAEQPISLETTSGTLSGTLQLPADAQKPRVALIIAGSGPTDRDGNGPMMAGRNDSLKMLAVALADAGFASVRYDKRGIAASQAAGPAEAALRFDSYVDDAVAWLVKLKQDGRFASTVVIGHSEGSLVGMLAAPRGGASAFVSLAGPAEAAGATLRKQLAGKLPPTLAAESESILARLERGETTDQVSPALNVLYRPSVQPYLISWLNYVPAERIAALQMPVLVAQGTTDIQVGTDQAHALKAAQPKATLAIIEGMNHVLKQVPADQARQIASYADPALPIDPALVQAIVAFLR